MGPEESPPPSPPPRRPPAPGPVARIPWIWIAVALIATFWLGRAAIGAPETIPYSEFKQLLAQGDVKEVFLETDTIAGTLRPGARTQTQQGAPKTAEASEKKPGAEPKAAEKPSSQPKAEAGEPKPAEGSGEKPAAEPRAATGDGKAKAAAEPVAFRTVRVEDPDLIKQLEAAGVPYTGVLPSPFGQIFLSWILPIGLLLLVFGWLFRSTARRAGSQMMGFGKSKARLVPETGTGVTFGDVAGCEEAKQELSQMVEFLKNPGRFTGLGGRIPKGVLLLGPPGTGKTLLARAVAGEAGVPFFSLSGSDFVEMFVGVGAARVRDLFAQATARAPCIIFVDEIDAIGRQRGVSMGVVNDEREQTLNQLLSEMDGFENNSGVIMLAATNRPEILDRALLRPGRFDRQIVLDSPDLVGREAILRVHTRGKPLAADVDLGRVAQVTPGMSGADLANAVNEAALLAAERKASQITQKDLEDAVERVVAGPERRSRRLQPEEKRRVAYHESGHALVAARCEHSDPVRKITIVPRGRAALGYTMQLPEQEHFMRTKEELLDRLAVTMGGRAAEELVFGDVSTGPQDDLRVATDIARQMVCVFGMSERLGLPHCARPSESAFLGNDGTMVRDCSEETSRQIDEEVRGLLDAARDRARTILENERDLLERLATRLLETETLDSAAFKEIVGAEPG